MKKRISIILMASIVIIAVSSFTLISCKDTVDIKTMIEEEEIDEEVTEGYVEVTVEEAKVLIDENPDLVILDVSPYYNDGHLPGAINYPVSDGTLDNAIPSLDPEETYLVYCHGDSPAITASQKLVDAGFMKVYRLLGNYAAWVDAGYEIEM